MLMLNLKPPESISTRAEGSGLCGCRISAQTSGASARQPQPRKTETRRLQSLKKALRSRRKQKAGLARSGSPAPRSLRRFLQAAPGGP